MALCLRNAIGSRGLQLSSLRMVRCTNTILPKCILSQPSKPVPFAMFTRQMAGKRMFIIHPSHFQWRRFLRDAHFFVMIGIIPLTAVTLYFNLIVGPAELAEIPEGYYPEEWEYHKGPVTRFLCKYYNTWPQKDHEQLKQLYYEETERMRVTRIEQKVEALQAERMDYQGYMWEPSATNVMYKERHREISDLWDEERRDPFLQL